ncbi:Serine/threonine-protein kinase H2 [Madurella mycetomatis]|uniref:Serine/threonine-protein kinase H2 n=1 Tax=Madurella mycetomatis TaxID=100816 RepID=A0A175WHW6_9PEZI|nr:Serine/threonine-protein kinase H2 [Madurella mycetomatis]
MQVTVSALRGDGDQIPVEKYPPPDEDPGPVEGVAMFIANSGAVHNADYNVDALGESSRLAQDRTLSGRGSSTTFLATQADLILGNTLRNARVESASGNDARLFLPLDAFDKIITADKIFQLLQAYIPGRSGDELQHLTEKVNRPIYIELDEKSTSTSRRKIFALLVLIDKISAVEAFIDCGLYDCDLPFILKRRNGRPLMVSSSDRLRESEGESKLSLCFKGWRVHDMEAFYERQWQFLAPFLSLATQGDPEARHYQFLDSIILPFVEDDEQPFYQNIKGNTSPSFAIKRLYSDDPDAFGQEVSNLKRLSEATSPYLADLLLTYYYRGRYHLVFRWASGNMKDFWEKNSADHRFPDSRWDFARWAVKQWQGLAKGLQIIHKATHNDTANPPDDSIYGRHGDIKPENILWFGPECGHDGDPSSFGDFVLSDFGHTRFHRHISKDDVDATCVGGSPTYRAPEREVRQKISQSYDMWSLGCVLLEFVVWSLRDWAGVEQFSQKRMDEEPPLDEKNYRVLIREDTFFLALRKHDVGSGNGVEKTARFKQSVKDELEHLRAEDETTGFLADLLDLIEDALLRMEPLKRSTCSEIVERLESMHERCQRDQEYCTRKVVTKLPVREQRTSSALSEISSMAGNMYREPEKVYTSTAQVADVAGIIEEGLAINNTRTAARWPSSSPAEGVVSASNRHGNLEWDGTGTAFLETPNTDLVSSGNIESETGPPTLAPATKWTGSPQDVPDDSNPGVVAHIPNIAAQCTNAAAKETSKREFKIKSLCRRALCCC